MNKHCKGCAAHYTAGHPQNSRLRVPFNDWCCAQGRYAKKAIGSCKLHNLKREKTHVP